VVGVTPWRSFCVTSVTAARAEDSSTMVLPVAKAATKGLDGEVVHCSGQAPADLVDQGDGVIAE
jgi:hypothetical protein